MIKRKIVFCFFCELEVILLKCDTWLQYTDLALCVHMGRHEYIYVHVGVYMCMVVSWP